jgi:fibrillarin-like pre-rRNA processing protein
MKQTNIHGVYQKNDKLFTENLHTCKGKKVYNEHLIHEKEKEFRSWNPYRSKLAAAILKNLTFTITQNSTILYLGAATGTTVSHLSDIVKEGMVYAVENSPFAANELIPLSQKRNNIIPILEDANHPERYQIFVPIVDIIYQDISQRNQAEIFLENIKNYLKKQGIGIIMVKARSIDVSLTPAKAYNIISNTIKKHQLDIIEFIDLAPYEKDHAAILISS